MAGKQWAANWIQCGASGNGPQYGYFRKEIPVKGQIRSALLDITADRKYKLWVNGMFVGEGPARSNIHYWSYDTYDLTPYLRPDTVNSVSVAVSQWNVSGDRPLALLAQGEISLSDGGAICVKTDITWKCLLSPEWRRDTAANVWIGPLQNGYIECRDLRREPVGWLGSGFDDSGWSAPALFRRTESGQPVRAFGAKWDRLEPRDIPYLNSATLSPVSVVREGEIKGTEIYTNKNLFGEHWWNGLDHISPLRHAGLTRDPDGSIDFTVRYEGESFGRVLRQPAVILDFGRLVNGYISLDVTGDAGLIIDVTWAQAMQDDSVYPVAGGIRRFNRYILRGGRQLFESFEYVNARFVQITVRGDAEKGFASHALLHGITLRAIDYPAAQIGAFECSDATLTRVWQATTDTVRLCMNDVFMDNTFREKGGWGGDVSVSILAALTAFGDIALIRRYLRMFVLDMSPEGVLPGGVPGWGGGAGWSGGSITDHSMAIPIRTWQFIQHTGDKAFAGEMYPALKRFTDLFEHYENAEGALDEVPGFVWFDWTGLDRRLPSVILNFYYCLMLEAMAGLADFMGDAENGRGYAAKIGFVRAWCEKYFDAARGGWPDSAEGAGDASVPLSEDTNGIALLTDEISPERVEAVADAVFGGGFDIYSIGGVVRSGPPFAIHVLLGLCRAGRHDLALEYMRSRHGSAFAQGLDTMPEAWIFSSSGESSAAQGTLPASFVLSSEILGIKPASPGFAAVAIEPHPAGLKYAKGAVPTPHGPVACEWSCDADTFTLAVTLPAGTSGTVKMPFRGPVLTVDGKRRDSETPAIELTAGAHVIVLYFN